MKSKTYRLILILLCHFMTGTPALSQDLYTGEVKVADESLETRNMALAQILGQVMVRVSGHADIMDNEQAKSLLTDAPSLAQQFRYRSATGAVDVVAVPEKYLSARFDPVALERLMTQRGLPVWNAKRPLVLVWVAIEVGANRHLLNVAEDPQARNVLQERAQARGMPLQLPLLDLQDQAAITAADVWADYAEAIRKASSRYPHDAVLTGRLRKQSDGYWSGEWTLWRAQRQQKFSTRGKGLQQVLAYGVDVAQDHLAVRLVPRGADNRNALRVSVEGIYSLADYAFLMELLHAVPGVQAVDVLEVDRERLLLGVGSTEDTDTLTQALDTLPGLRSLPGTGRAVREGAAEEMSLTAERYFALIHKGVNE